MRSARLFLYQLLNQKKVSWAIIFLATAVKSTLTASYSSYETDKSFYLLLAKNLWAGEGFTIPVSLLGSPGITENIYLPSAASPLYSIIAAPLLGLFPDNYFLVTWLIESFSWLLLFIILHKLLFRVTQDHFWSNLFILFSGFFIYSIELSSPSKDMLALAALFTALWRCISTGDGGKRRSFSYHILSALLFILPGLIKYTYLPLAVVFPLSILFIGFLKKQKSLLRSGVITFVIAALLVAGHYFYFNSLEVQAVARHPDFYTNMLPVTKQGKDFITGFFPENLRHMYPFIPASLANLTMLSVQVKTYLSPVYPVYAFLLFAVHFTGVAAFIFGFFFLAKRFYRKPVSPGISFVLTGMFISLALLLFLSVFSVRYQAIEYKGGISFWTFMYHSRPFIFTILFLQLCLFAFLFAKKHANPFLRPLRTILLLVVGMSFLHGFFFAAKAMLSWRHPRQKAMSLNRLITHEADSIQKANPGSVVWIATEIRHADWYAKLNKQKVLNNLSVLNDSNFSLPAKTILLTAVAKEDTIHIRKYLRRGDVKEYRNYDNTFFLYREGGTP